MVKIAFHLFLDIVRQVAEEVDARQFLQLVDADCITFEVSIGIGFVFHPEAYGSIATLGVVAVLLA